MRAMIDRTERIDKFASALRTLITRSLQVNPVFADTAIVQSFAWYDDAHAYALELSERYGLPLIVASGIVAAMSIRTRWNKNLADAELFLRGGKVKGLKIRVNKASALLDAEEHWNDDDVSWALKILGGRKIQSFAHNIMYHNASDKATIDVWMCRAFGVEQNALKSGGLYDDCEQAVQRVAKELEMPVPAVQALVWILIRGKAE